MKPVLLTARLQFDQEHLDLVPNKYNSCEKLYVDFTLGHNADITRLTAAIHPKTTVTLQALEFRFSIDYPAMAKVFCSGLHPGSHASEISITDKPRSKGWLAAPPVPAVADPEMPVLTSHASWSYGYLTNGSDCLLVGSTNEATAYTAIGYDITNQQLVIQKDIAGLELSHSFPVLELIFLRGSKDRVLEQYFSEFNKDVSPSPHFCGWLAHKNNGTNSDAAVRQFLTIKKEENIPADLILIGSGYETFTGDWLFSNDNFPDGLPALIETIRSEGLKAGMAISPLLASQDSAVFKEHADWFLVDKNEKLAIYKIENEKYHVLDIYHSGVQDYLQVFCYRVINQWGISLLRIDHLSAAYAAPRPDKTRAQVIAEIMRVMRGSCAGISLWATGLPIIPGYSQADYTATAANNFKDWDVRFPALYYHATSNTSRQQLKSALHRFHPTTKAGFSVINLSDTERSSVLQQQTVLVLTTLLGRVNLLSAIPEELSDEAWAEWRMVESLSHAVVRKIEEVSADCYQVKFANRGVDFVGYFNLSKASVDIREVKLKIGESVVLRAAGTT